ncbi:type IV toxin-antitoxin system AbiEi family antitoxin domain-containing protein [Aldersonia kunmingensis]|uniref:type IV toxin-antitoxin system AbiEi family antitoxin domain-containing protein n=1 Tax=Aldersonia kunmingensis TaxID=408066 RepID=UPI0008312D94|nr:hypothetical protein [Aldersonia kunmingensis]
MSTDLPQLIRRRDALARGFSDDELQRERRGGRLHVVRPGYYVQSLDATDDLGRHRLDIEATVAASGPDAVVSHVSAALLHGIALWDIPLDRVHLTLDARSGGRIVRRRHVHTTPLSADEIATVEGVAVTSAARTVIDLARTIPFEHGVVVADSALHEGLVSLGDLALALEMAGVRRGVPRARRVLAFADGRSESVGESRSRVLMHSEHLPAPDLQREIRDDAGRTLGRVDFFFERYNTIGEFDGMAKYVRYLRHGESPADAVEREKIREDGLRATSAAVARWTWSDLATPTVVTQRLRRAFELGLRR